jgi:hypothetical protein
LLLARLFNLATASQIENVESFTGDRGACNALRCLSSFR